MNSIMKSIMPIYSNGLKLSARAFSDNPAKSKIEALVKNHKVVVFMKGIPEAPRCGFSNAVIQILRMHGVNFQSCDVLADENIRQAIKEYTEWPTIPQVFINGEFIGGCDIMLQMHQSGHLLEEFKRLGIRSTLLGASTGPCEMEK